MKKEQITTVLVLVQVDLILEECRLNQLKNMYIKINIHRLNKDGND